MNLNFFELLGQSIQIVGQIATYLILFRVILSWIPVGRNSGIVRLIYALTEPILSPIRNLIRKSPLGGPGMMLDFSPIIAYLLIYVVSTFLAGLCYSMMY